MGYEQSPATKIVATHCVACSRPLIDADSVEAGMGPTCRSRYLKEPENSPTPEDFARAWGYIAAGSFPEDVLNVLFSHSKDARKIANVLVHFAACQIGYAPQVGIILNELGYNTLSEKLLDGVKLKVARGGDGMLHVNTPFTPDFNKALRQFPGVRTRRNAEGKFECWAVPTELRDSLRMLLSYYFYDEALEDEGNYIRLVDPGVTVDSIVADAKKVIPSADTRFKVEKNGDILDVKTPYNPEFIAALKQAIPWKKRSWNSSSKTWVVNASHLETIVQLIFDHYNITVLGVPQEDVPEDNSLY